MQQTGCDESSAAATSQAQIQRESAPTIRSGLLIYWNDSDNAYRHPHRVYRVGIGDLTLSRFFRDWLYRVLHVPFHVTQGLS